ncbi:MAG: tetratricopeptide repeat protein [Candidatus Poribacteria bacterium]|nr:tetratricopeptide repeat protein [Candidatus Poribacteria bacterium]
MQVLNRGLDDTSHKYSFAYNKQTTLPQQGTAEEYNARGISHTKNGEYDLAIAAFRKAIKISPGYAEAYCNIGIVYECKGEYHRAIEVYTEVIQHNPNCVEAYNNRGIVYGEKGQRDLAIKDFNKAIELKRDYAKAYNNRGAVYRAKGENDRAIEDCSKAIKLDPYYADPYSNRGAAYRNKGEVNFAIEDYDKAIELNPYFFVAYYNRGIAYQEKRDYDLAIEDYNKAIELIPKHAHPYNNRGNTYLLKGDSESAIKDYNKAIELNPELAVAYYNRGEAWLNQQEWGKAKTDLITAKDMGLDIAAVFRNGYKNVEAFEDKHKVKLPADIVSLVRQGFRYRYPMEGKELNSDGESLESPEVLDLLERFRNTGTPLGEYVKSSPYFGIETVPTEVFVVDKKTRDELIASHPSSSEILKSFLRDQDVRRWQVEPQDQWLLFTYRGIEIESYPAVLKYLKKYKDLLSKREDIQEWYELQFSLDEAEHFAQPKLICPKFYNRQTFAVETQGFYCGYTCYIIPTKDTWLCGLLNTLAVEWFYSQISEQWETEELEVRSDKINQIPVPDIDATQKDLVRKLVDYLIYIQQQPTINNKDLADSRDIAVFKYFEWIINGLVYEFYLSDILKNADRDIFKYLMTEQLPEMDEIPEDKMPVFRSLYERLHDRDHPVRVNLFFQDSLRPIRIIEGKW